jgi:glycosyltransferase domain-containing protein
LPQNELITILIPTYNRPNYLKRLLGYYNECGITHPIIIADGSSEEIKKTNKETISSFPVLNLLYLGEYTPETKFNTRLSDGLKHINTKYCVICADDDFITPEGMSQSVNFLESHNDYTVAHGRYIFFSLESGAENKVRFSWTSLYSSESSNADNPAKRVYKQLAKYPIATFYAVHNTHFMQWVWEETLAHTREADALFSELLLSALTLAYGKMKCLDVLFSVKDHNQNRVGYVRTFKDYIEEGTYQEQYARFKKCLVDNLSKQSGLSPKNAGKIIDKAMHVYMKAHYPKKSIYIWALITVPIVYIMDRIHFPRVLRAMLRRVFDRVKRKGTKQGIDLAAGNDFNLPSSLENDEEIEIIQKMILSYPTN